MVLHFDFMGISSGAISIDDAFEKLYARFTQAAGRKVESRINWERGGSGQEVPFCSCRIRHQTVFVAPGKADMAMSRTSTRTSDMYFQYRST
jgi:hypothetical protein